MAPCGVEVFSSYDLRSIGRDAWYYPYVTFDPPPKIAFTFVFSESAMARFCGDLALALREANVLLDVGVMHVDLLILSLFQPQFGVVMREWMDSYVYVYAHSGAGGVKWVERPSTRPAGARCSVFQ